MDEKTFQSVSLIGIGAANVNLRKQSQLLSELSGLIQERQLKEAELKKLRDLVFQIKTELEDLTASCSANPAAAFYNVKRLKPLLSGGIITSETFSEFQDKEYYRMTCKLADVLEIQSSRQLGDDGVAEIKKLLWYEDVAADLRKLVTLRQCRDVVQNDVNHPRGLLKRCNEIFGKCLTPDGASAINAILVKQSIRTHSPSHYPYRELTISQQLERVDADIAQLQIGLSAQQFNAKDYPTTAKLTAVYEAIQAEMSQIQNKYWQQPTP